MYSCGESHFYFNYSLCELWVDTKVDVPVSGTLGPSVVKTFFSVKCWKKVCKVVYIKWGMWLLNILWLFVISGHYWWLVVIRGNYIHNTILLQLCTIRVVYISEILPPPAQKLPRTLLNKIIFIKTILNYVLITHN